MQTLQGSMKLQATLNQKLTPPPTCLLLDARGPGYFFAVSLANNLISSANHVLKGLLCTRGPENVREGCTRVYCRVYGSARRVKRLMPIAGFGISNDQLFLVVAYLVSLRGRLACSCSLPCPVRLAGLAGRRWNIEFEIDAKKPCSSAMAPRHGCRRRHRAAGSHC